VLGHVRTLGNRSVADGCARVPEVFTAAKLEGLVAGVIIPKQREPAYWCLLIVLIRQGEGVGSPR